MELFGRYKLMLMLKRANFKQLEAVKRMVDKEYNKRLKDSLVVKK